MAKLVLQQCISARLQTNHGDEAEAEYAEIDRGVVAYICFTKEATETTVNKLLKLVSEVKLSRNELSGKLVSVTDLPGDILIVPQATLGGKLRGKTMQYHNNINKLDGRSLYGTFVKQCEGLVSTDGKSICVKHGTYGNLQVLNVNTQGPYTHTFDVAA